MSVVQGQKCRGKTRPISGHDECKCVPSENKSSQVHYFQRKWHLGSAEVGERMRVEDESDQESVVHPGFSLACSR